MLIDRLHDRHSFVKHCVRAVREFDDARIANAETKTTRDPQSFVHPGFKVLRELRVNPALRTLVQPVTAVHGDGVGNSTRSARTFFVLREGDAVGTRRTQIFTSARDKHFPAVCGFDDIRIGEPFAGKTETAFLNKMNSVRR